MCRLKAWSAVMIIFATFASTKASCKLLLLHMYMSFYMYHPVACRCLDRIIMEITTGDVAYAGGGPHSVEITVSGETKVAQDILSATRNEVKLIPISLSDLGFSDSCITTEDIESVALVESSNDGLYFTHIEFYATFSKGSFATWVDGDNDPAYLRVPVHPQTYSSCGDVLSSYPTAASGNYDITLSNGSVICVYCDMEGLNCDGEGGWMRVANIDLTDPEATCPSGLTLITTSEGRRLCYQETSSAINRCDSSFFSSKTANYSKVCGRVRGYRDGNLNGFYGSTLTTHTTGTIDTYYVDGVSITYGSSPRQHIWTYVGSFSAYFAPGNWFNVCPCNTGNTFQPPSYVGNDYYCESAASSSSVVFDDPLWDGQDCQANEAPCCTTPNMPWFIKTLGGQTSSDIELRVCAHAFATVQDTPLDLIELYVK